MSPSIYVHCGTERRGQDDLCARIPAELRCRNFINADLIAQGMAPFSPETAAFRAGKLMLTEIDLLAQRRADFGFETTLSGRSYLIDWSIEKPGLCRALLLSLAVEC